MKKLLITTLLAIVIFGGQLQAQSITLGNIKKTYLRSTGEIISGKEIVGYYNFYFSDKADKNNNLYTLVLLDENLNKIGEKEIVEHKDIFISDAAFNGEYLAIKFLNFDKKNQQQIIKFYDEKLNEVKKKTFEIDRKAYFASGLNLSGNTDEVEGVDLHGVNGIGFLNFTPILTKGGAYSKTGIRIQSFPVNSTGYREWTYNTADKLIEYPFFLFSSSKTAFVSSLTKKKIMSNDLQYHLVGFDLKTGKELCRKELLDDKYEVEVINGAYIEELNKNVIFGNLNSNDKKSDVRDKNLGLFFAEVDNNGNVIGRKDVLWSEFAKNFKPTDEKGKEVEMGKVYIHKILRTNDGSVYAIGERFRKAASAMGIASAILNGSSSKASAVKIVFEDLVVIKFDKDFNPLEVKFIDKGKSQYDGLPAGVGMYGYAVLGSYLKTMGAFDYQFTSESADGSSFSVGYRKYKGMGGKKENYFGTINYTVGDTKYTEDKIELSSDATNMFIYPAKRGYVMIYEYYKKLKQITMRLEKINY